MAWEALRTDYVDAVFDGFRKYLQIANPDGTYSFSDVTAYIVKENAFVGAKDLNAINSAINAIMAALNNGTSLYDVFNQFFMDQQELFKEAADEYSAAFLVYLEQLKKDVEAKCNGIEEDYKQEIERFETVQQSAFMAWFEMMRDQLSKDAAGHLQLEIDNKLDKTGNSKDNTVTFTSVDAENPEKWTDMPLLESGKTHNTLWSWMSTAVRNLRYLWKLLGSTDISAIGDGTVTGALDVLNSNLKWKLVKTVTGGDEINLPTKFNELMVICRNSYTASPNFTFSYIYDELKDVGETYCNGFYYSSSLHSIISLLVSKTQVKISAYQMTGVPIINTATLTVYYR